VLARRATEPVMRVLVVEPDPAWWRQFGVEAANIAHALGGLIVAVHHIGSTAIPGIFAKPVIDILLEVNDIDVLDRAVSERIRFIRFKSTTSKSRGIWHFGIS
jgi:GrpB-like predicted nucleotidyltransferase (UPF0157 family)